MTGENYYIFLWAYPSIAKKAKKKGKLRTRKHALSNALRFSKFLEESAFLAHSISDLMLRKNPTTLKKNTKTRRKKLFLSR